jgi:lipoprotein-releasing system permease protein
VNIAWFLAKRIAVPTHKTFSSFIVKLCTLATAISVAVMILSTSLFDGFEKAITHKFYNAWGNLQIMNFDASGNSYLQQQQLSLDSSLIRNITNIKQVKSIHSYAIQHVVFKSKNGIQGAMLKGVNRQYDWARIQQTITIGKPITYADSSYSKQIIISTNQAAKLNVTVGDSIIAYIIAQQGEQPRARKLQICGIYETGLIENDKLFAYTDIALIHRINADSTNNIFGYECMLHNPNDAVLVQQQIQNSFLSAPLEVYRIQERFAYIFQWLGLIKSDLSIIYIIMLIVAVMNIISGILILILERTQMVGILKSVGNSNASIQQIFFWQSLFIAGIGILIGIVLAITLCLLQQHFSIIRLDPTVYYVSTLQVDLNAGKIAIIAFGTLVVCGLLLLIPTYLVNKINPIKALRFD